MSDANRSEPSTGPSTAASPATTQGAATVDRRRDPAMRALYQMSRTAGVGLQDYAAVNNLAVIGIACAAVSVALLVLLRESQLYYVTGVAGLVLGVIALVQIVRSNGTQAGKGLAIGAAVLSIGVIGVAGAMAGMRAREDAQHRAAIIGKLEKLGTLVQAGNFDEAYALFDPRFQERVKKEQFTQQMSLVRSGFGMKDATLAGLSSKDEFVAVLHDFTSGTVSADALMSVSLGGAAATMPVRPITLPTQMALFGDIWLIHDIPDIFPAQQPKK